MNIILIDSPWVDVRGEVTPNRKWTKETASEIHGCRKLIKRPRKLRQGSEPSWRI